MSRNASPVNVVQYKDHLGSVSRSLKNQPCAVAGWDKLIWNYWGVNFAAVLFKLLFASLALPELLRVSSLLWYIKRSCPSNQITKKSCLTFISFPISWKHKGIRIGESPNILLTPPIIGQSKVCQSAEQERGDIQWPAPVSTPTLTSLFSKLPFLKISSFPSHYHPSLVPGLSSSLSTPSTAAAGMEHHL